MGRLYFTRGTWNILHLGQEPYLSCFALKQNLSSIQQRSQANTTSLSFGYMYFLQFPDLGTPQFKMFCLFLPLSFPSKAPNMSIIHSHSIPPHLFPGYSRLQADPCVQTTCNDAGDLRKHSLRDTEAAPTPDQPSWILMSYRQTWAEIPSVLTELLLMPGWDLSILRPKRGGTKVSHGFIHST